MNDYKSPEVTEIGSLDEVTLSVIHKTVGSADVIVIGNESIPAGGGAVTSVS